MNSQKGVLQLQIINPLRLWSRWKVVKLTCH